MIRVYKQTLNVLSWSIDGLWSLCLWQIRELKRLLIFLAWSLFSAWDQGLNRKPTPVSITWELQEKPSGSRVYSLFSYGILLGMAVCTDFSDQGTLAWKPPSQWANISNLCMCVWIHTDIKGKESGRETKWTRKEVNHFKHMPDFLSIK